MTTPEWRQASTDVSESRDYFDTLLELLIDCTTLLDYLDRILQHGDCPELFSIIENMLYYGLILEDQLLKWNDNELPTAPEWTPPKPDKELVRLLEPLRSMNLAFNISEPFQFPSFKVGQMHLLYWTGMVLLYPVLSQLTLLYNKNSKTMFVDEAGASHMHPSPNNEIEGFIATKRNSRTAEDFTRLADHSATQVCRSTPFFLQSKFKAIGSQTIMSPLWVAQQFFQSHLDEYGDKDKWCVAVFGIVNMNGLGFASRLAHLPWSKYPREQRIVGL